MVGLYFLGILVGILMALLSKNTMFKGEAVPFVMELPNYRMPGAKNVAHLLWDKAKDFLQRAFTVIFLATIVVWFLQTFDFHLNVVADSQDSILATIAGLLTPIFAPLGFGDCLEQPEKQQETCRGLPNRPQPLKVSCCFSSGYPSPLATKP